MKFKIITFLIVPLAIIGCKKIFFGNEEENTPENNFEVFWNDFNQNYAQFEVRHINWDSVYQVYRPKVTPNTSDNELFNIFTNMVYTINDMHVSLYSPFGSIYWKSAGFGSYPSNKYINLCNYVNCAPQNNKIFEFVSIKNKNWGYIVIHTFNANENKMFRFDDTSFYYIDKILGIYKEKDGLIIDVRNNPGGELFNAMTVASRFADERRFYAKFKMKNGPGKNDFTDWQNQYVEPKGKFQFKKSVVIITSRSTCSAAEQFVLAMKSFSYVTTVGDTTGGGLGLPMFRELPNGWSYRLSTCIGATADGFIIEGKGIPPDYPVITTKNDSINKRDRLIEKSLEILDLKTSN